MNYNANIVLVIGLGNPILGDDGVGWHVVEKVEASLNGNTEFEDGRSINFEYLSLGGLALMENMVGYTDVIVVDSILTRSKPNGTVYSLPLSRLPNLSAGHTTSTHDTSLATALEFGKKMGMVLPEDVWVIAVEAEYVYDFSEELSEEVQAAVPQAVRLVLDMLRNNSREEKIYDLT
jgi:hydrogenase maturation protease